MNHNQIEENKIYFHTIGIIHKVTVNEIEDRKFFVFTTNYNNFRIELTPENKHILESIVIGDKCEFQGSIYKGKSQKEGSVFYSFNIKDLKVLSKGHKVFTRKPE